MPGDRLPFAIRVGGQEDPVGGLGGLLDLGERLRLFLYSDVFWRETVADIDAQLALGQVAEMPHGRLDRVAAAKVLADRFGLGRGLDNDECAALYRSGVGYFVIRRRKNRLRIFLLAGRSLLFGFHFLVIIRHVSTFVQPVGVRIFTNRHSFAQV